MCVCLSHVVLIKQATEADAVMAILIYEESLASRFGNYLALYFQ